MRDNKPAQQFEAGAGEPDLPSRGVIRCILAMGAWFDWESRKEA